MGAIQTRRAGVQTVRNWVEALGVLCCDNMTPTEAEMKVLAFVPMLQSDFPAEAFTQDSLSHVARECKYFPSYGEVYNHLSAWWRPRRPMQAVALPAPAPPPPHVEPTPDERAYVHEQVRALVASFKSGPLYSDATPGELKDDRRPKAIHLSPGMLDLINPLPNGHKRAGKAP